MQDVKDQLAHFAKQLGDLTTWVDKHGKTRNIGDLSGLDVKHREDNKEHIFDDREGHVVDSPENQKKFIDLVKDPKNFLTQDRWGKWWYAKILEDGTQAWAEVRNEIITNCGINETPLESNDETGLSKSNRPSQKK